MSADESLVVRRSKRSTAGNRMEAVLAELGEVQQQDVEEDIDFQFKDEQDVFGSDFESTEEEEEEAAEASGNVAEKSVQEEEKRARKTTRSKLDKATALAHARQKATFNPQAYDVLVPRKKESKARRGIIIDPETGEVTETNKRKSQRLYTVMNRSATVRKIVRDVQEKKGVSKKHKAKLRPPTQDELMARALDMEEGNVVQHRDYLVLEEEKRKRARVVRAAVEGPLLRWASRVEEVTVQENPGPTLSSSTRGSQVEYPHNQSLQQGSGSPFIVNFQQSYTPQSTQAHDSRVQQYGIWYGGGTNPSEASSSIPLPSSELPPIRKEKVAKNYVMIEMEQSESAFHPPTWKQTMDAMFGDHVKWEEVRVYVGKNRPLSRPRERCPITGLAAKYCDPRTGVPYANVHAFKEISKVLDHEYIWSEQFGCYVGRDDESEVGDDFGTDEGESQGHSIEV